MWDGLAPRSTAAQWSHLGINHSLALRQDWTRFRKHHPDFWFLLAQWTVILGHPQPALPCSDNTKAKLFNTCRLKHLETISLNAILKLFVTSSFFLLDTIVEKTQGLL